MVSIFERKLADLRKRRSSRRPLHGVHDQDENHLAEHLAGRSHYI